MGTPEFAVASLEAIYLSKHEVVGVVTAPDKPAGRGQQLQMSEVKKFALEHQLPVLQPVNLKSPEFIEELRQLNADLFVVVAFRMLPEAVFGMPPKGTFNVHASLLPEYRGAAPIHWAVMNGEKTTGVTTFFLNREIDKGDIIACKEVEIGNNDTTGELHDRLKMLGAELAVETINMIEQGNITPVSQQNTNQEFLKPAPKIFKKDTFINWADSAAEIFNKIRGLSPYPGACTRITTIQGETVILKCFSATLTDRMSNEIAGTWTSDGKTYFAINTKDFQILLQNIQIQGRNRMDIGQFLQGFKTDNYTNTLK